MELEAENLWVQSTRHDFDDKKIHQKYYFFLIEKISNFFFAIFKKYFLELGKFRKFSLEINIKMFKKSRKNRECFDFF